MQVMLSFRMLLRDWRAGELRVLAAALLIAVAGVTSVAFFTDRIRIALEQQAIELLGADVVITGDRPLSRAVEELVSGDLQRARTVEFPSMVIAERDSHLAAVKAVSERYPLRGNLRISRELFAPDAVADGVPEPGTVWLESRLLGLLGIDVGDAVTLGDAELRVAAILTGEPVTDGGLLFSIAPRIMLNLRDLDRTGLVQPASRVQYRWLFAGDPPVIEAFRAAAATRLADGERIADISDAQPQVREALERARSFLGLAALVSVLLAGVAVAMSTRRFIARHLDGCAVMRCLGARQWQILRLYALQLLWLGLLAAIAGCAVGWLAQFGLERVFGGMLQMSLPAPSGRPLLLGLMTALITLLGFALPPLLHLRNVPALRVLRRELGGVSRAGLLVYGGGVVAMTLLILWHTGNPRLAFTILFGAAGALGALALVTAGLILLLRRLRPALGAGWRFSLLSLTQRSGTAVIQVMAFGLGITVLLLLLVVRGDILAAWEGSLPADAPNRFLINIQPDQVDDIRAFFAARQSRIPDVFPMVRGQLVAIGDRRIVPEDYDDDRAQRLVRREFNLSWAERMQEDNRIVAGQWWTAAQHGAPIVSVEKGLADTLGIGLGDRLVFDIGGGAAEVEVTSLREVEWDSFRANFFVLAPPGVLDDYPVQYISSFHVPPGQHGILNELVRAFPNITVIDIAAIMNQVRLIMDRVAMAVEYVFLFTLVSGLLVMYAAIHATLDERIRETVLLRTLGAARGQLLRGLVAEFTTLGLLAGLVAATAASLLGWLLSTRVFQLDYAPNPGLWLSGMFVGAIGVGIAGVLGTRFILNSPPVKSLRETL
jgi:putative ABC transport system permease protein